MDAYWEFGLNPWDTAAGFLLVEEAGGMVTAFDGAYRKLDSREILASNQLIHHEMLSLFQDMFAGRNLAPLPSAADYAARRAARDAATGAKA
jgi:myo-inositol-1(or 4)-monophosphatase